MHRRPGHVQAAQRRAVAAAARARDGTTSCWSSSIEPPARSPSARLGFSASVRRGLRIARARTVAGEARARSARAAPRPAPPRPSSEHVVAGRDVGVAVQRCGARRRTRRVVERVLAHDHRRALRHLAALARLGGGRSSRSSPPTWTTAASRAPARGPRHRRPQGVVELERGGASSARSRSRRSSRCGQGILGQHRRQRPRADRGDHVAGGDLLAAAQRDAGDPAATHQHALDLGVAADADPLARGDRLERSGDLAPARRRGTASRASGRAAAAGSRRRRCPRSTAAARSAAPSRTAMRSAGRPRRTRRARAPRSSRSSAGPAAVRRRAARPSERQRGAPDGRSGPEPRRPASAASGR